MENYQIWEIKNAVSELITPLLKEYITKVEENNIMCIPTWIEKEGFDVKNMSTVEMNKEWSNILKRMLYPFTYQIGDVSLSVNFHSTREIIQHNEKFNEGLRLFAKFFENLWD